MTDATIALCLSGQIRTPPAALAAIAEQARLAGVDVFVSVWRSRGGKTFDGAVGPKNIRRIIGERPALLMPDLWLGRMRDIFPDFERFFPPRGTVTEAELQAVFPGAVIEVEAENLDLSLDAPDSNSLRMLYRIWRANALKRAAEKARGRVYDRVIRARPDMLLDLRAMAAHPLAQGQVLVQGHEGARTDYMNDTYWVARSGDDDRLAALFGRCLSARDDGTWQGIHPELFAAASAAGLTGVPAAFVRQGLGEFDSPNPEVAATVSGNFVDAVIAGQVRRPAAGPGDFPDLVAALLASTREWALGTGDFLPDQALVARLPDIAARARNAHVPALLLLGWAFAMDSRLPFADRLHLSLRGFDFYTSRRAFGPFEVRATLLPEVFAGHEADLAAVILGQSTLAAPQSQVARTLCEDWDKHSHTLLRKVDAQNRSATLARLQATPRLVNDLFASVLDAGRPDLARDLALGWGRATPDAWRPYEMAARAAQALGDDIAALALLDQAVNISEPRWSILEARARLHQRAGRPDMALSDAQDALDLPGCHPRVRTLRDSIAASQNSAN